MTHKRVLVFVQLFFLASTQAEFIYGSLFEYTQNLTAVFKDPGHVYGEDVLRTYVFYLDELMELEDALKDEDEHEKALKMLSDLYHDGGPKHIHRVPYPLLIDTYNWTSQEVDDLARYIEKTTETWQRLLKVINDYIGCGKIKAKKLSSTETS